MANDKEILDDVEKIVDKFTTFMYDGTVTDQDKPTMAVYYMGMLMATIAKRTQ